MVAPPLTPAALLAEADRLRGEGDTPVRDQHVVSRVVLKQFAKTDSNGVLRLLAYGLEFGHGRHYGIGTCGRVKDWMPVASASIERVWSRVETDFPRAIKKVGSGTIFQNEREINTIKRVVALHYVRSPHLRNVATAARVEAASTLKERWLNGRTDELARYYARLHGGASASDSELEEFCRVQIEKVLQLDAELTFRVKSEENFRRIQHVLSNANLEIITPPRGRAFLISDSPTCTTKEGTSGVGLQKGIGLYNADRFEMPLSSEFLARISPSGTPRYLELSGKRIDRLNVNQIRNAYRYVYCGPESRLKDFIAQNSRAWQRPPEIRA